MSSNSLPRVKKQILIILSAYVFIGLFIRPIFYAVRQFGCSNQGTFLVINVMHRMVFYAFLFKVLKS